MLPGSRVDRVCAGKSFQGRIRLTRHDNGRLRHERRLRNALYGLGTVRGRARKPCLLRACLVGVPCPSPASKEQAETPSADRQ